MSNYKPISLAYPIVFIGGVLFLCAWGLHGNRIFAPFVHLEQEVAEDLGVR